LKSFYSSVTNFHRTSNKPTLSSSENSNSSPTISLTRSIRNAETTITTRSWTGTRFEAFVQTQVREQVQMKFFRAVPAGPVPRSCYCRKIRFKFQLCVCVCVRRQSHINLVYSPVDTQSDGGGGVGVVEGDGTLLATALIIAAGLYRGTCNTTGVFTDRSTGSSCTGGPAACNERKRVQWLATTIIRSVSTHWA